MNPSSSQFPTSNVKVLPHLSNNAIPERTWNDPDAEYSKTEKNTRTYVKRTENEAGKEVFEGQVARPLAGRSRIPLGADSKTGGFGTAYSTTASGARQRAFNRAEDDRIKSTSSEAVKKHSETAEARIKEFESNPRSNAYVKNRPVVKINSGKAK
jgi:hypothetical protein